MREDNVVISIDPDPFQKENIEFWKDLGMEMVRKSENRIDDVGKHIITIDVILIGFYVNAIAFSNLSKATLDIMPKIVYMLPLFFILLSLSAALLIFYPDRLKINLQSSDDIRLVYQTSIKSKLLLLRASSILLITGVITILIAMLVYVMPH